MAAVATAPAVTRRQELRRVGATATVALRHGGRVVVRGTRRGGVGRAAAVELRHAFSELGPTYVKLAQLIASSPGLFPEVLTTELRLLLDAVPPMSSHTVRRVLRADLGAEPDEVFAAFDPVPLASASIAQVHAARLSDGTDVVVKVQRPGIGALASADVRILRRMARGLELVPQVRLSNPVGVVEDFAQTFSEELDFTAEAGAMSQVGAALVAGGHDGVRVPAVHWDLTTPRVLTMERVDGCSIDDERTLAAWGVDPLTLVRRGVLAWLDGALRHGVFHGDVHAGNLMVDRAGRLVMLDFGITGRLDEATKAAVRDGLIALLVSRDYLAAAASINRLGGMPPGVDLAAVGADMAAVVEPMLDRPLGEIAYGEVLLANIRVSLRHRIRLPRELILVSKQLFYFERYAKLLCPGWNILGDEELLAHLAEIALA